MAQPSSMEVLARNACVQLLLYEGTRDGVLSLLETECFKAVSEGLLNRIVRYSPKVLTDRMLSALISSFVKELNLSKCENVSLVGLARALKRSPHVRHLYLRHCSQLMCPDIFVYLGLLQLPVTHLSLENTTHIEDAAVHVLISQLPHLTTLDLSNNFQLTDNVFLLDVDDQTEKEMSTGQKKTSYHYNYCLTSVDISACRGLSMLSILHLTSLCGPRLKHINFSWTKISCEALLFLAGYNLIDTTWLLLQELLRQNEKQRKQSLYNAVQCMMEPIKSLVHHKALNSDTKSEEAAAERSEISSENDTVEITKENENTSESTKVSMAQGSENSVERNKVMMAQDTENPSESDIKVKISQESLKSHEIVKVETVEKSKHSCKSDIVEMAEENELVMNATDCLNTVAVGENTGIDNFQGELRNSQGAIYIDNDGDINRTVTEGEHEMDEDSCVKDASVDIGLSEIICEIDEIKNSENKLLQKKTINDKMDEVPVSLGDSVELDSKQSLDDNCEHQAMAKLEIGDTPCEQSLDTYSDNGLNTAGSDTTEESGAINKYIMTTTDWKEKQLEDTLKSLKSLVEDGIDIDELLEEWNILSTQDENKQASPMFDCSLVSLEITSIMFRDNFIGAFCLEKFFEVNKKLQKFGITWKGLSGDLMKRLVPSLSELREVDMVDCTMLGTEGVRVLGQRCVKLNKINLKGVDFFGDFAIHPALSSSTISSLSLAGSEISDASLLLIADKQAKSLTELDLSWCEETITEKGINAICEHCTKLRVLNMPKCPISDITLLLLSESCRQMTDLSFQCVDDFQTDDTFSMGSLTTLAQHLTNLRRLDISWNLSVKDEGVCAVLSYCTLLEKAIMSGIKTITVAPFLPIISGHTRDERKEKVDEETTELMYKSALSRSAVYAPNLRKLLLEYCDLVDEHQLKIVIDACRGTLTATDYYGSVMC